MMRQSAGIIGRAGVDSHPDFYLLPPSAANRCFAPSITACTRDGRVTTGRHQIVGERHLGQGLQSVRHRRVAQSRRPWPAAPKDPHPRLAERLHQGRIVELADQMGMNALLPIPGQQAVMGRRLLPGISSGSPSRKAGKPCRARAASSGLANSAKGCVPARGCSRAPRCRGADDRSAPCPACGWPAR